MPDATPSSPLIYELWHHAHLGPFAARIRHRQVTGVCFLPDLSGDVDPSSLTYDDGPSVLYRFRECPEQFALLEPSLGGEIVRPMAVSSHFEYSTW